MGMPFQRQKNLKPPENLSESTCFLDVIICFCWRANKTGNEAGQGHSLWVSSVLLQCGFFINLLGKY